VAVFLIVFLEEVSVLKWTWKDPPSYIRVPVGILWPIWGLLMILSSIFGSKR
jgi:hypothetical protein